MHRKAEIDYRISKSDNTWPHENFVAVAVAANAEGNAYHAGFVIQYNEKTYLFHYIGVKVKLELLPIGKWYFHKNLEFIAEDEIPAFYNHCRVIEQDAKPTYGYFYGGSYYIEGKYFSETGQAEIMTCVTFCLNVILGFIESEEYIFFDDWNTANQIGGYTVYNSWGDAEDKDAQEYIDYFIAKFSELATASNLEALKLNLRRIYPVEYLSSAFFNILPIRKISVDEIFAIAKEVLKLRSRR